MLLNAAWLGLNSAKLLGWSAMLRRDFSVAADKCDAGGEFFSKFDKSCRAHSHEMQRIC
jgi:hypothetical protein